jgi:hypothetical protein
MNEELTTPELFGGLQLYVKLISAVAEGKGAGNSKHCIEKVSNGRRTRDVLPVSQPAFSITTQLPFISSSSSSTSFSSRYVLPCARPSQSFRCSVLPQWVPSIPIWAPRSDFLYGLF